MNSQEKYATLGIDIGSTTVKIAILDEEHNILFSDYERHFANIRETLSELLKKAYDQLGELQLHPMITGSGGLTLANHLGVPFTQEVVAVATSLQELAPKTDVAIELGGEDAKIIYFEGGNVEQRMNGICAGGTGSFIDQMASLIQTDASGLNEYAKNYKSLYTIAARCGVFAKTDIQPLINEGATKEDLSASIFQAVVNQTISGLACGKPIRGHVAFLGGPLHFLSIYSIEDNMFYFWYRFIPDNASVIARGAVDLVYKRIEAQLNDYMGKVFEEICTQYLWKLLLEGEMPIEFAALGRWWGNDPRKKQQTEIDIMGEQDSESAIFAECKWRNEKVDLDVLETLVDRSGLFHYTKVQYFLFSKTGFTKGCVEKARKMGNVTLVRYEDIVSLKR